MKKVAVKVLSVLLCLLMVVPCFSILTSAENVTYRKGSNDVSSAYKGSRFYKNLTQIPLTGDGVTDVLAVALSQLGYVEGTNQSGFNGTQGGGGNYTEFCYNMGSVGGYAYAWCAAYVSWCLLQSRCTDQNSQGAWARNHMGDKNYIWREVGCPKWYENLKQCGYGYAASSSYTPKSGDLVFFTGSGHIGIVRYVKNGTVYTIEGNTGNAAGLNPEGGGVYCKSYARSYSKFLGFGSLPYKKVDTAPKVDYTGENPTTGLWIGETNKYLYTSSSLSGDYTVIPKGTFFEVTKIVSKSCYQVKYDGKTGYVQTQAGGGDPIYQATSTSTATSVPTEKETEKETEAKVTPNKYAITSELKKVKEHIGSGISKFTLDGAKIKEVDTFEVNAGQKLGIEGYAGFSTSIKEFGYYFDGNSENAVLGSKAKTASATVKGKAGDKAKQFAIEADTSSLTGGAHTVTYLVKFTNGKTCDLVTLNLNVSGSAGAMDGSESSSETGEVGDGCGGVITAGFALPIALAVGVVFIKKKKED